MTRIAHWLLLVAVLLAAWIATPSDAHAQYPVAVVPAQPVVPGVVGYTAERRGLFGWRVVYRPIVAPVPVAPAVSVAPAIPVASAIPVAPAVTVARPVIQDSVVVGYPPPVAPVTSYYAPPVTVVPPVSTYRVPVPVVVPYSGF